MTICATFSAGTPQSHEAQHRSPPQVQSSSPHAAVASNAVHSRDDARGRRHERHRPEELPVTRPSSPSRHQRNQRNRPNHQRPDVPQPAGCDPPPKIVRFRQDPLLEARPRTALCGLDVSRPAVHAEVVKRRVATRSPQQRRRRLWIALVVVLFSVALYPVAGDLGVVLPTFLLQMFFLAQDALADRDYLRAARARDLAADESHERPAANPLPDGPTTRT